MKAAMKARDQVLINTTRGVISEIKRVEIDTRKPVEEDGVVSIVQKEVKKRRDALEFAHKAARNDLIEQNELEIKLLQKYLGEQLSEEKLTELVASSLQTAWTMWARSWVPCRKTTKASLTGGSSQTKP